MCGFACRGQPSLGRLLFPSRLHYSSVHVLAGLGGGGGRRVERGGMKLDSIHSDSMLSRGAVK